jgi:hypothetical protein
MISGHGDMDLAIESLKYQAVDSTPGKGSRFRITIPRIIPKSI